MRRLPQELPVARPATTGTAGACIAAQRQTPVLADFRLPDGQALAVPQDLDARQSRIG